MIYCINKGCIVNDFCNIENSMLLKININFPKIHKIKCSNIYTEIKIYSIGQIFLIPAKFSLYLSIMWINNICFCIIYDSMCANIYQIKIYLKKNCCSAVWSSYETISIRSNKHFICLYVKVKLRHFSILSF